MMPDEVDASYPRTLAGDIAARQDETLAMLAELVRYVAGTRLSDHVTTYHPSMTSAVQLLARRGLCQVLHATDTGVRAVWVR